MVLYTINDIEYCNKKVFGKVNLFQKYKIQSYESNLSNNIQNHIRIIGTDKIKKNYVYMQVNEFDFLEETKKIGRQLYEVLFNDLIPLIEYNEPYIFINQSIVKIESLNNKYEKIAKIVAPFFKQYGMPIDYSSFSSSDSEHTNSIDLNDICTLFLLIHIISDLAFHHNEGYNITNYYKILGIDPRVPEEKLMDELLNPSIFIKKQLGVFNLKFENLLPVYYTNNLFSFAYERLKLNIIERKNSKNILARVCKCGNPIIEDNTKGKRARANTQCDDCIIKDKKEYNRKKSRKNYKLIAKKFHILKKAESEIEMNDFNNMYYEILMESKKVRKIKDFKIKKHSELYMKILRIQKSLKATNK